MIDGRQPFPERPILITFDDARADSFALADPVLARYGLKATMFVPTARILDEDGFHAGWDTIRRHAASGRWEMQAHGHDAHSPVVMNPAGGRGEFLAYRRWLPAEGRAETPAELVERIAADHVRCKAEIERHVPGQPVIGYAFPLNQVAYAQDEGREALRDVNERIGKRYFRFGAIQDDTGYNRFRAGEAAPFMLRRFEAPEEWTAEELLAHLARHDPVRSARLALARLALAEGRPRAARKMIQEIVREEPLVAPQAERTLAEIAWEEDRPRSASSHLAAAQPSAGPGRGADTFSSRVAWRNSAGAGFDTTLFSDSDRRSVAELGTTLRYPLPFENVELRLRAGHVRMTERSTGSLSGLQVSGDVGAALGRHLQVSGWARHRELSELRRSSLNGGLEARLRAERHSFSLRWSSEEVDTVPAQVRLITHETMAGRYALVSPAWRFEAELARFTYSDGNLREDVQGTLLRRLGPYRSWAIGAMVAFQDARFDPPEYWAPRDLVQAFARVSYSHAWRGATSFGADVGLGGAHDPLNDVRPAAFVRLQLSRWWGSQRRVATTVELQGRAIPAYQSAGATFRLELRF
jgi:peptidoglycan/xylan/chitin deacetylase (PgdA/CDA1 family)